MDGFGFGHRGLLFADDFDAPAGVVDLDHLAEEQDRAAPAPPPPDLVELRQSAYADGHRAGLAAAMADRAEVTRHLLGMIEERLAGAGREAQAMAEASAASLVELVVQILGRMLPATCARNAAAEAEALVRALLPALVSEPTVSIAVNPGILPVLEAAFADLGAEWRGRLQLHANETLPIGDLRVGWQNGAAMRSPERLWREIAASLALFGLVDAPAEHTVPVPVQ